MISAVGLVIVVLIISSSIAYADEGDKFRYLPNNHENLLLRTLKVNIINVLIVFSSFETRRWQLGNVDPLQELS